MGNGPSRKPDPEKRGTPRPAAKPPPDTAVGLVSVEVAGSGASTEGEMSGSFCTRPQIAEFYVTAEVEPDTTVRLVIGRPPTVRSISGETIGELTGQTAAAMRSCLEEGYAMEGTVANRLLPTEVGRVVVKGRR